MDVDAQIAFEVNLYVSFCRAAARHDELETWYKTMAHTIFYHIQDLRSTSKVTSQVA